MLAVFDVTALVIGILVAAAITAVLLWAHRGAPIARGRGWIAAGITVGVLTAIAAVDLARDPMHSMKITTPITGTLIATIGALGMVRATRRVPVWLRAGLVFIVALVTLFGGLLLGAGYVSRLLPF